ncbi:MAG TPA: hypothetical protein VJP79_07760 [Nitrososphaera sp.]|nr:hypothetical protein [Nitrososphaera sp.]
MDNGAQASDFVPFLTIMSTSFEKDVKIVRQVLSNYEKAAHVENGYRLSENAEMAAGWWFYDVLVTRAFLQKLFQLLLPPEQNPLDKKEASLTIVRKFQEQLVKYGSESRVKLHGQIPFAAPWWAWLMR